MKNLYEEVRWVGVCGTDQTEFMLEIVHRLTGFPLIYDIAFHQQNELVEECKYLVVGLMDCEEDGLSSLSQIFQFIHDDVRSQRVYSGGRFIEGNDLRVAH
jgi:hypothetical protein